MARPDGLACRWRGGGRLQGSRGWRVVGTRAFWGQGQQPGDRGNMEYVGNTRRWGWSGDTETLGTSGGKDMGDTRGVWGHKVMRMQGSRQWGHGELWDTGRWGLQGYRDAGVECCLLNPGTFRLARSCHRWLKTYLVSERATCLYATHRWGLCGVWVNMTGTFLFMA